MGHPVRDCSLTKMSGEGVPFDFSIFFGANRLLLAEREESSCFPWIQEAARTNHFPHLIWQEYQGKGPFSPWNPSTFRVKRVSSLMGFSPEAGNRGIQDHPTLGTRVLPMAEYSPPPRQFGEARAKQGGNASQNGPFGPSQEPRDPVFKELQGPGQGSRWPGPPGHPIQPRPGCYPTITPDGPGPYLMTGRELPNIQEQQDGTDGKKQLPGREPGRRAQGAGRCS